jgi:predicted neuraminidase
VHASAIVQCPNGDLRACWYENGPALPSPPYLAGDRDKSDDVRIGGSRLAMGASTWDPPCVMSDTFGTSDNNPTMIVDRAGRLWLFHSTMLGAPKWSWGSSLLRYRISTDYNNKEESPRDKLAVALSTDRGQTWSHERQLEDTPDGRFDYPSIIQAKDGTIHVTYSYNLKTIKHVQFNEAWIMQGGAP